LVNPALESALPTKVNFTQKEWAAVGITHLHFDDYVMSKINDVGHYFQPAAGKFEQWACKSEASEEYKPKTLRMFQTAPPRLSERRISARLTPLSESSELERKSSNYIPVKQICTDLMTSSPHEVARLMEKLASHRHHMNMDLVGTQIWRARRFGRHADLARTEIWLSRRSGMDVDLAGTQIWQARRFGRHADLAGAQIWRARRFGCHADLAWT